MQEVTLEKWEYPAVGETLYKTVLPNGLRLFFLPKPEYNETYGILSSRFGSVDTDVVVEGEIRRYPAGIAHFLEHKLFEKEDGADFLQEFASYGAESNAFTSFTKTSYLFSATDRVAESVKILQDLVAKAHFSQESVAREQEIIGQEIEMYQDNPDYRLFFETLSNLYPNTPLAQDIAGSRQSVEEIDVEQLEENFRLFYQPSNLSLLLVGNFEVQEIFEEIKAYQAGENREPVPVQVQALALNPVIQTGMMRMEVASPKLAIGLRGKDEIADYELFRYKLALKLLFAMMFGWTSQRFQRLYEQGKLDHSLTLEVEVEREFHFVILTMDSLEPVSLSHQLRSAIRRFEKDTDVSEEHLDTIKSEMFGDFLHGLNSLEYIATQYESHLDGENLFDTPKILQELTLVDVLEVGRRFIENCDMVDFTIFQK